MNLFLKKILYFISALAILIVLIGLLTEKFMSKLNVNYLASFEDKISLLQKTEGTPRVIFIGGSNLTFGLNSEVLKDSLHANVANLSLHGGIGLNNEVDLYLNYLNKEKDIIIISAEFETLSSFQRDYESDESLYCKSLFPSRYKSVKTYLYWFQRNNPVKYFWDIKNDPTKKIGHRKNLNSFGDVSNLPPLNMKFKFKRKNIKFNDQFTNQAIQFIKERMDGFTYYVASPVINSCWDTKDLIAFDDLMKMEFGEKYIITTREMHFNDEEFYDTHYHLNELGRSRRTQIFIPKVKRVLE